MWQKNINDFDRVVAIGGGHGMGRVLSSLVSGIAPDRHRHHHR